MTTTEPSERFRAELEDAVAGLAAAVDQLSAEVRGLREDHEALITRELMISAIIDTPLPSKLREAGR